MTDLSRRAALGLLLATPLLGGAAPSAGAQLAAAARRQVGVTLTYDPGYRGIPYPNGDVPRSTGVCADVLIRAARDAWQVDLQQRVHEDMGRAFAAYPSRRAWGLKRPDANIDHRRVLNLETYLTRQHALLRQAAARQAGDRFEDPRPGDILTWRVGGSLPHIGVIVAGPGQPRVVHNIGQGARDEPLSTFQPHTAVGHYRWVA